MTIARTRSRIAIVTHPAASAASLENLEIYGAGVVEVGTPGQSLIIDELQLLLWDSAPAMLRDDGSTIAIPPGGARFAIRAAAGDLVGVISATNETEIRITSIDGHWATSSFTIAHRDPAGQRWALVVMPSLWE